MRWPRFAPAGALATWLVASGFGMFQPGGAGANGVNQREIQGRVESVDAVAGTVVVASEFRGKTTRVTLRAAPKVRIFDCAAERTGLDQVRKGMTVSVFYEVVGADGVVNLIVVEPSR
jgi:hypothetical protein